MFYLECYKHPGHKERQAAKLTLQELCERRPDERTIPYFSISNEQLEADQGYQNMNGTDQGDFLRLLPMLWRSNGLLQDFSKAIAKSMGFTEDGLEKRRQVFLSQGLLEISPDGIHLINQELRQQYLNILSTCNDRRHR